MTPRELASYLLWQIYCVRDPGWKTEFLPPLLRPDPEEAEFFPVRPAGMTLRDTMKPFENIMEWNVERYWTLKRRQEEQMETFRNQVFAVARCLLRRTFFVVFAKEYFARNWETQGDWQISKAFRQFYWHSLVTLDAELNQWLGLPVIPLQMLCDPPDWEEVYRVRVLGASSEHAFLCV